MGAGCRHPPGARLHPEAAGRARRRRRARPRRPDGDLGRRRARLGRPRARGGRRHPPRARAPATPTRWPAGPASPTSPPRSPPRSPRPGAPRVRLRLDLTYAPGPRYPSTWNPHDVRDGFAQAVVMTGLATQLPRALHPSPLSPEREVATALVKRLQGPRGDRDPAPRTHLVDGGAVDRAAARQRRVRDLRRGARLRARPQRELAHREPHPAGGLRVRAPDRPGRATTPGSSASG